MRSFIPAATLALAAFSAANASAQAVPAEFAAWKVQREVNPIDDAQHEITAQLGGEAYRGSPLLISVRCVSDATEIVVMPVGEFMPFNEHIAGTIRTKIRFDKDEALSVGGNPSTSDNAYFLADPIALVKRLATAQTLAIEITTDKAQFISTFPVGDFLPIAQEIADGCHWDLPESGLGRLMQAIRSPR